MTILLLAKRLLKVEIINIDLRRRREKKDPQDRTKNKIVKPTLNEKQRLMSAQKNQKQEKILYMPKSTHVESNAKYIPKIKDVEHFVKNQYPQTKSNNFNSMYRPKQVINETQKVIPIVQAEQYRPIQKSSGNQDNHEIKHEHKQKKRLESVSKNHRLASTNKLPAKQMPTASKQSKADVSAVGKSKAIHQADNCQYVVKDSKIKQTTNQVYSIKKIEKEKREKSVYREKTKKSGNNEREYVVKKER